MSSLKLFPLIVSILLLQSCGTITKPSIVYKDIKQKITCPPVYMEKSADLEKLSESTNIPVYMKGTLFDYYELKAKHEGLLACIQSFNSR